MEEFYRPENITEYTAERLNLLSVLSKIELTEIVRMAGVDVHDPDLHPVDVYACDKLRKVKNQEVDRIQDSAHKLFENRLPDWVPLHIPDPVDHTLKGFRYACDHARRVVKQAAAVRRERKAALKLIAERPPRLKKK